MTNQSVTDLRRKLNEADHVLKQDLNTWDPRTRPGLEGRQNQARREIDTLKSDLAKKILENSTTMLVLRDVSISQEIIKEARENSEKVVLLDFLSTEKWLVKAIYGDKATSYPFNGETVNRLNILISDEVGDKIMATQMPILTAPITMYGTSKTRDEIISKFEGLITAAYGTELKQHLFRVLLLESVYDRLQQDEVAVFMMNVPKNFTQALSSYTGKTIAVTEDATMAGALVLNAESSASELVGAVTKAQALVKNKPVRSTNRRKPTETSDQQDTE